MSDRRRISREKLAYLVDSTAAPIAGLAIISTWIAFEVGLLQALIDQVGLQLEPGRETSGYSLFLAMLPFRFYCLITLAFVLTNTITSRDFGPMLEAERRAASTGQVLAPGAKPLTSQTIARIAHEPGTPCRWYNAVLPIVVVVVAVVAGMLIDGWSAVVEARGEAVWYSQLFSLETWKTAFGSADSGLVLFVSSLIGSAVAIGLAVGQRILGLVEAVLVWLRGVPAMTLAVSILICAWAIRSVCEDLGTSTYLVSAIGESIPPVAFPLFAFLLAAAVAFATGTSWGTMGILLPVVVPWAWELTAGSDVSVIIAVVSAAAVLDGAIMGDHCSPISDTTVMSSIAASCDHVDHVRTQMPYAVTCMAIATVAYVFVAADVSPWIAYAVSLVAVIAVLRLVGKKLPEPSVVASASVET
jgi:Na+/H+ antiporter NhaC